MFWANYFEQGIYLFIAANFGWWCYSHFFTFAWMERLIKDCIDLGWYLSFFIIWAFLRCNFTISGQRWAMMVRGLRGNLLKLFPHVMAMAHTDGHSCKMSRIWRMYDGCMADVYRMYIGCMPDVCRMHAGCMANVCRMYGQCMTVGGCMKDVWQVWVWVSSHDDSSLCHSDGALLYTCQMKSQNPVNTNLLLFSIVSLSESDLGFWWPPILYFGGFSSITWNTAIHP